MFTQTWMSDFLLTAVCLSPNELLINSKAKAMIVGAKVASTIPSLQGPTSQRYTLSSLSSEKTCLKVGLHSLKLTANAPKIGPNAPKGNNRLPTIHFQVAFAVSFREGTHWVLLMVDLARAQAKTTRPRPDHLQYTSGNMEKLCPVPITKQKVRASTLQSGNTFNKKRPLRRSFW